MKQAESTGTLAGQKAFSYFPGCSLHSTAREYDVSARLSCEALGIELKELEGWACCGASSAHSTNELLAVSLPARDLKRAGEVGLPLVAACAMCFSRLKIASHELQNNDMRKLVQTVIGQEIQKTARVVHLLEVVDSRLDAIPVKKPLTELKVACYYGCLLVRPREKVAIDDAENPQLMDRLVRKLGAEPVAWAFKTECCGAGLPLARPDIVLKLCHRILAQARQAGADCIAVACPECHSNLDTHQEEIRARYGDDARVPVVYFTQLLGLALGLSVQQLHLDKHLTDPVPVLSSKGLA
ncbi:MAG: CoB--CoM heterodisulfide reductase iron-sulfur subunit B family protein [Chloroflexota bacterium]